MDGLRGLSVGIVVVGHLLGGAEAVYILIDAFFVLSGFLLANGLMAMARRTGTVPAGLFFAGRALRLLPAFGLLIALVLVLSHLSGGNVAATTSTGTAIAAASTMTANWYVVVTENGLGYLAHVWFLSMEEQFYLALPLIVALVLRAPRRALAGLGAAVVAIAATRAVLTFTVSSQLSLWTPLRADGMLVGVAVAVGWSQRDTVAPRLRILARPAAGFAIVGSLTLLTVALNVSGHPLRLALLGGSTAVALITAAALWHFLVAPTAPVSRFFTLRPLVAAGRWSYGLYLFHYPFFLFAADQPWGGVRRTLFAVVGTAALTTVSWLVLERPAIRVLERATTARRARPVAVPGTVALVTPGP